MVGCCLFECNDKKIGDNWTDKNNWQQTPASTTWTAAIHTLRRASRSDRLWSISARFLISLYNSIFPVYSIMSQLLFSLILLFLVVTCSKHVHSYSLNRCCALNDRELHHFNPQTTNKQKQSLISTVSYSNPAIHPEVICWRSLVVHPWQPWWKRREVWRLFLQARCWPGRSLGASVNTGIKSPLVLSGLR